MNEKSFQDKIKRTFRHFQRTLIAANTTIFWGEGESPILSNKWKNKLA